uniref:Uncharacterized protein n=1 Tax=Setaria digitata TaxID=48799 RepID=A0A915PCN6_9BILA
MDGRCWSCDSGDTEKNRRVTGREGVWHAARHAVNEVKRRTTLFPSLEEL